MRTQSTPAAGSRGSFTRRDRAGLEHRGSSHLRVGRPEIARWRSPGPKRTVRRHDDAKGKVEVVVELSASQCGWRRGSGPVPPGRGAPRSSQVPAKPGRGPVQRWSSTDESRDRSTRRVARWRKQQGVLGVLGQGVGQRAGLPHVHTPPLGQAGDVLDAGVAAQHGGGGLGPPPGQHGEPVGAVAYQGQPVGDGRLRHGLAGQEHAEIPHSKRSERTVGGALGCANHGAKGAYGE